VTVFIVDTVWV